MMVFVEAGPNKNKTIFITLPNVPQQNPRAQSASVAPSQLQTGPSEEKL